MPKPFRVPLGHWSTLVEGLRASPQDCYAALEAALAHREIPGAQFTRVEYKEARILSAERLYLRASRKMLGFDICAAPFGNGFFFSWWQGEIPPSNVLGCLAVFLGLALAGLLLRWVAAYREALSAPLTTLQGGGLALLLALGVLWIAGRATCAGYLFSEDALLATPLLGPLYNAIFRPPTYYKLDTIDMYQKAVHAAVLEVVDAMMSAQGLRALGPEARQPTLRSFLGKR